VTHTAVEWVLDQLASVVSSVESNYTLQNGDPVQLRRVDRDNSQIYKGSQTVDMSTPISDRTDDFERANFVGASFVDRSGDPIGSEYDLDLETVVSVRIEGYSGGFGHVDPSGADGVPFETLVNDIRSAIYDGRKFPDAGRANVSFTHLLITNETPQSDTWQEYHRHDFDVVFDGFEEL